MHRAWIIELSSETDGAPSEKASSCIDKIFRGFTRCSTGSDAVWWACDQPYGADSPPLPKKGMDLMAKIPLAQISEEGNIEGNRATIFLLGSAADLSTQSNFCSWAARLKEFEPSDFLGSADGSIQIIGILRIPEELFTASQATEDWFVAFLTELQNAQTFFDAIYLLGDEIVIPGEGASFRFGRNEIPELIAQLMLHLSMPEPSVNGLRGICSAGVFALHASWERFTSYCDWLVSRDLWDHFVNRTEPPFANRQALAGLGSGFRSLVDAGAWYQKMVSIAPAQPDLNTSFWSIPGAMSPWRIWTSRLLDQGNLFLGWFRDWVRDLNAGNANMASDCLKEAVAKLSEEGDRMVAESEEALRSDFNRLGDFSHPARSLTQYLGFLDSAASHVESEMGRIPKQTEHLFNFPGDKSMAEMVDSSRIAVEEGRDATEEARHLGGLTDRIRSHPSLLAFLVRALFGSALLALLVPPVLAMLHKSHPDLWVHRIPIEAWTAFAYAFPVFLMILSVVFRHNHIRQHARKLTALTLARLEAQVANLCSERCTTHLKKLSEFVCECRVNVEKVSRDLLGRLDAQKPNISHPELAVTSFQQPLLGIASKFGVKMPEPSDLIELATEDGLDVTWREYRPAGFNGLLRSFLSGGGVKPEDLALFWVSGIDSPEEADQVKEAHFSMMIEKLRAFASARIKFKNPSHTEEWASAADPQCPLGREIRLRSTPSVEKNQGHDIREGNENRCTSDLAEPLSGHKADITGLNGFASWMQYNKFPNLASAIPNLRTLQASDAWLERLLREEPTSATSVTASASGLARIEVEEWTKVPAGTTIARIGDAPCLTPDEGYVVFEGEIDGKSVESGALVARVLSYQGNDPILLRIFARTGGDEIPTNLKGGTPNSNAERLAIYKKSAESLNQTGTP